MDLKNESAAHLAGGQSDVGELVPADLLDPSYHEQWARGLARPTVFEGYPR
jgi:hypothetical protein